MLVLFLSAAMASQITLQVGVYRGAGSLSDIVIDGEVPICEETPTELHCQSASPLTWRWHGDSAWELVGDMPVEPGQTGHAWILAADATRTEQQQTLASDNVTAQQIRDLFVRTGDHHPDPPSSSMLQELVELTTHRDKAIRREVVTAMQPWFAGTPQDPMARTAPLFFDESLLMRFARDSDPGVRRRLLHILRDLHPSVSRDLAHTIMVRLTRDRHAGVRRAAMATLRQMPRLNIMTDEEVWKRAFQVLPDPGPPGRAACNTLASLAKRLPVSNSVNPAQAIRLTLKRHPGRAWRLWTAWRKQVPLTASMGRYLLLHTVGLSEPLFKTWAKEQPALLTSLLQEWEPQAPHTGRWHTIRSWLANVQDTDLRVLLQLPLPAPVHEPRRIKVKLNVKAAKESAKARANAEARD